MTRNLIRELSLAFILGVLLLGIEQRAAAEQSPRSTTKLPVIRDIRVEIRDIFDGPDLGGFYRTVNALKISTKETVVRQELLLAPGDVYNEFLVSESERNLRALPFIRQASIIPVQEGEWVDLIVSVQDTWTLIPELGLSTGGGSDRTAIGLSESNFLGLGKRLELLYADDEGREKIEAVWDDKRLFGTRQRLLIGHFERSDGYRSVLLYGEPFRSLTDPNAWTVNTDFSDTVGRLFEAGDESFIFRQQHEQLAARYTFSRGEPDVLLNRHTFGYEYSNDEFREADEDDFDDVDVDPDSVSQDPALLADDRRFSGPYWGYDRIEPDFISINYVDRFDRVEDFNLGNVFSARVGLAPKILDSRYDTLLLSLNDSEGTRLSPTSFLRGEIGAGTRVDNGGFDNTVSRVEVKYVNVLGAKYLSDIYLGKHTIAMGAMLEYADDFDRDRQFVLGASSGLRGYENRTFTGNKRYVFNIEERFHIVEDVFRLVNLGGALFFDGGGVSDEFYSDFGIGLRIGFPRSSGGSVARFDLAFPLRDGPDGSDKFEPRLLFTTGQFFNAGLRSESQGPGANVTIGSER